MLYSDFYNSFTQIFMSSILYNFYYYSLLFKISDIDECVEQNGVCSQHCENTDGSYICKCSDGYKKLEDGHTCKKIDGNVKYLWRNGF